MSNSNARRRAKELVEKITSDFGYIGEETLQMIPDPNVREKIMTALDRKDKKIGSAVITLAKNLYTSKARFIFELLQNADDNNYIKARASGKEPYVAFRIYSRRIVLECNEDGFNEKNLKAICDVGQSSKTGAQGYIGEKGIGFKSVFMAAWKVHIQSGAFSFSFNHKSGDSGMGMISPIWEDTHDELDPSLTRITLYLHETGDPEVLNTTRKAIDKQLKELQETFLLFMKNLKRIEIRFYDENGERTGCVDYSIQRLQTNRVVLKRNSSNGSEIEQQQSHFHVTNHQVTNLSRNENRTYSNTEEASRSYSKSNIVLAFPLSGDSVPIIKPQDLFVFLPVRSVGFNFLIQADFVTDASRQDIVRDSLRNHGLLDGIADDFIRGILQFCEHPSLRYLWMRYLPDKNASHWGTMWLSLVNKISDRLVKTPILYGRKKPHLRLIRELYSLPDSCYDEAGEPLLDDGSPEKIISGNYGYDDLELLKPYGFSAVYWDLLCDWLQKDLDDISSSRMKSSETSEEWHTRTARLFHSAFTNRFHNVTTRLLSMNLLPLDAYTWTSTTLGPVYFGKVDGLNIPSMTGLRLIPTSVTNPARTSFFKVLGVKTASVELVRQHILQHYPEGGNMKWLTIQSSKNHLHFLYLTENKRNKNSEPPYSRLSVLDNRRNPYMPTQTCIYTINEDTYGPWELLRQTPAGSLIGSGAPGYRDVIFLNEQYFLDAPAAPSQEKSWKEWLHTDIKIARHLQFDQIRPLGPVGEYVQRYRPECFLGALLRFQRGWGNLSADFKNCLRDTPILCRGDRQINFKATYFPTKDLEARVRRYVPPGAFFPWIWLEPDGFYDVAPPEWRIFLAQFTVGYPATDLDFALDMLKYSIDAFPVPAAPGDRKRLFMLYDHIHTKFREHDDQRMAQGKIRIIFTGQRYIYIPSTAGASIWAYPHECVWSARQLMKTKHVLQLLYEPGLNSDDIDHTYTKNFFTNIIGVPSQCTWQYYVEELNALKASGCTDSDIVTGIYEALDLLRPGIIAINKDQLRNSFENDALIYAPSDDGMAWRKVSECVWSSAARLKGKVSLNDDYGSFEELFVDLLGVKPVDLSMAIDELKEDGRSDSTSTSQLKESIRTVNTLLQTENNIPDSNGIIDFKIFPARYPNGQVAHVSLNTDFFIVDREHLRQSFESKVKFLDFSLEEVARLRSFFEWIGLKNRYLSSSVREVTSFHGEGARLTTNPELQIYNRAHALLRIAVHFGSPRVHSHADRRAYYEVLSNAEILETDGISSDLQLLQDGMIHVVEGKKATLHIDEGPSGLKVYIPRNKNDQRYTFNKLLPEKLFQEMMKSLITQISVSVPRDGITAIRDVLLAPRSRIKVALDDNGVADIDIENEDEEVVSEPNTPQAAARTGQQDPDDLNLDDDSSNGEIFQTPTSSFASPSQDQRASSPFSGSTLSRTLFTLRPPFTAPVQPATIAHTPPHVQITFDENQYIFLLSRVISTARSGAIPDLEPFGMNQMHADLPTLDEVSDYGLRSMSQIERDLRVGAAGELYVFELISHLRPPLPNFTRSNWQSTIRKYVTRHPDYADMQPWAGSETSDITYTDSESSLTEILIEKGYLPSDRWAGRSPKYYIEVKTTTSSCETPFYMSKAQYRRMRSNTINSVLSDVIYVIFRVYRLGRSDMGLRIYLDPEALRVSGDLNFTAETWSVVPR